MVIGLFWAASFGDPGTTLRLCLFYELFWLDGIPAGTHIPPNAAGATLAGLSLMHVFGLSSPAEALLVGSSTAVLARLFAALEGVGRAVENIMLSRYLVAVKRGRLSFRPGRLIRRAACNMVLVNGTAFCVCLFGLITLYSVLLPRVWPYLSTARATWSQLWLLGSLGGILSLRYRPAYVVLAFGAGLAALWPLWRLLPL